MTWSQFGVWAKFSAEVNGFYQPLLETGYQAAEVTQYQAARGNYQSQHFCKSGSSLLTEPSKGSPHAATRARSGSAEAADGIAPVCRAGKDAAEGRQKRSSGFHGIQGEAPPLPRENRGTPEANPSEALGPGVPAGPWCRCPCVCPRGWQLLGSCTCWVWEGSSPGRARCGLGPVCPPSPSAAASELNLGYVPG